MGKYKLNIKADREKLIRAFDKYLPKVGTNVEYGEAYGYVLKNEFRIHTKTPARNFRNFAKDRLIVTVDDEGQVEYTFARDIESILLTLMGPNLLVMASTLMSTMLDDPTSGLICLPFALILYFFNFIKPKKQREDLLDCLLRMIELSETK